MTLAAPGWLALLLLTAPIVLLHMRRRRRVRVPSLLLWRAAAGEQAPRSGLGRVPPSVTLALQLLALLLAALTLARPVPADAADHLVLLLDGGWRQNDAARLAGTVASAKAELDAHPGATWSLIVAGGQPRPLAARWPAGRSGVADVRVGVAAEDSDADWAAAVAMVPQLLRDGERTRLVLVGAPAGQASAAERQLALGQAQEPQVVSRPQPGGATVRFGGARLEPEGVPGAWRLTGSLLTDEQGPRRAGVRVTYRATTEEGEAAQQGLLEVELGQGAEGQFDAQLDLAGGGLLQLTLVDQPAAWPLTFVVADPPPSVRVLYLGGGNEPLRRALAALPEVELTQALLPPGALPALEPPSDWTDWDLVVLDGIGLADEPATSTLRLGAAALPEPAGQSAAAGAVTGWDDQSPLSQGVEWDALVPGPTWPMQLLPGAAAVVRGAGGPLLQSRLLAQGLDVRLAFDLRTSDWVHEPGFLRFVANLVQLVGPAVDRSAAGCVVGLSCALPAGVVAVADPRGVAVPLARFVEASVQTVGGAFVPTRAGVYELTDAAGRTGRLAVNAMVLGQADAAGHGAEAEAEIEGKSASLPVNPRPLLLGLLLLVLLAEAWFGRRTYGRGALLARVGVLLLLVLALADLRLPLPTRDGRLVIVAPEGAVADEVSHAPGITLLKVPAPGAAPLTNLEAAVDLAAAHLPPQVPGGLLLSGDGAETAGDFAAAAARLAASGTRLDALPLSLTPPGEVLVRGLSAPGQVMAGDRFALDVLLHAERASSAELLVSRNGDQVTQVSLELTAGEQRVQVTLPEAEVEAGQVLYEVRLLNPPDGTLAANDRAAAWVGVLAAPRLLLVADEPAWSGAFAAALRAQGLDVTVREPAAFPSELEDLLGWHAVILMNVPAVSVPSGAQLLLEEAVEQHGLPLLLLGGDRAFGPGGYLETPLDRLSPTSSLVSRQAPELAIAFVLDRSNSMRQYAGDQVRLDIAKVAALQAFELLPEGAQAALIVFDSVARTLVPLSPAADGDAFRQAILDLEPRGGTAVHPALVEALEQLEGHGAASAHVIVMSDGLSQPGDFAGVLGQLRQASVTVSTIGIGPEADADQLRQIAALGGGSFHFSADFGALPGIMAHEVLLRTGELQSEASSVPVWRDPSQPLLGGWPDALPAVTGFVPTTLKDGARLHLSVTDEEGQQMPLLASWRYGAGQVVALTTHAAGPWAADWLSLPDYATMWAHLVRQVATTLPEQPLELQAALRGNSLTLRLSGVAGPGPSLELEGPDGARRLPLGYLGAGRYGAQALLLQPGPYLVRASDGAAQVERRVSLDYLATLDLGLAQPARLAATALATGGGVLSDAATVSPGLAWIWPPSRAWPALVAAALALLLLELLLRYPFNRPRGPRKD